MAPHTYGEVLARNLRAARSRLGIGQENLAIRMRALGYSAWIRQTVGSTERGKRRPTAEEILGLAYALETSIAALMQPRADDRLVEFPTGAAVAAVLVAGSARGIPDESVAWRNDTPVFAAVSWPAGLDLSDTGNLETLAAEFRAWKAQQGGDR